MPKLIDLDNYQSVVLTDEQAQKLREYFESGKLATYEFVCDHPTCRWEELLDKDGDILLEPSDAYDDALSHLNYYR